MSVFLHALPFEDGHIVTGPINLFNTTHDYDVLQKRTDTSWMSMGSAGGASEFVAIFDAFGTYLASGDTGFHFDWLIYAQSTGTLELTQDFDSTWAYTMPSPVIETLSVDAAGWTAYRVSADPIDADDLIATGGARLGLRCTSGNVSIMCVQLQVVPDSGNLGWWRYESSDTSTRQATQRGRAIQFYGHDENFSGDWQGAWEGAWDDLQGQAPLSSDGSASITPEPTINISVLDWSTIFEDLAVSGHIVADHNGGAARTSVGASPGAIPTPAGADGTAFIRKPDFTVYDNSAYVAHPTNWGAAYNDFFNGSQALYTDAFAIFTVDLGTIQQGDYDTIGLRVDFWIVDHYISPEDVPVDWLPGGTPVHTVYVNSTSPEAIALTLPTDPNGFTVFAVASNLLSEVADKPHLLSDETTGVEFGANMTIQSGSTGPFGTRLEYTVHFPSYVVWDPNAVPPTSALMMTMGDGTSVTVGDPNRATAGRVVMEKGDGTKWIEYRTTDGSFQIQWLTVTDGPMGWFRQVG